MAKPRKSGITTVEAMELVNNGWKLKIDPKKLGAQYYLVNPANQIGNRLRILNKQVAQNLIDKGVQVERRKK